MSVEMTTYVPAIDDSCIPHWLERLNGLGMRCEIHPEFSFEDQSGFLPFKIRLSDSAHKELIGVDYLTGFELDIDDFDIEETFKAPSPGKLAKLFSKQQSQRIYVSPEIDERLKRCKKSLSFRWGTADDFELRMATVSAAILAELTNGVCHYPADGLWYDNESIVEKFIKDAVEYENSLSPHEIAVHKFEEWL